MPLESGCREERTFSGLELDERLRDKQVDARCGLMVIDIATGSVVHTLDFGGGVQELYDVQVLPDVRCPSAIGLQTKVGEAAPQSPVPSDKRADPRCDLVARLSEVPEVVFSQDVRRKQL